MKRTRLAWLLLALFCVTVLPTAAAEITHKDVVLGSVTASPNASAKYKYYRIPGIITTEQNTLIAYFEARTESRDDCAMDIVAYRSTDGGKTFGDPIMLAEGTKTNQTTGSPVMIAGKGREVHFLYCVNYGVCTACGSAAYEDCPHGCGVFYRKSTDDGVTWSKPVNITAATDPDFRNVFALGPGHGIRLTNGTLLVPVWIVRRHSGSLTAHSGGKGSVLVSTLYSTDNGANWQLGELIEGDNTIINPNETTIVETFDGRVMLNARSESGKYRAVAYSKNGYSDWTDLKHDKALIDPICFGSSVRYNGTATAADTLLFVNCAHQSQRTNLTLRGSLDNGKTWLYSKPIADGMTGYADVTVGKNGDIYVLYEVNGGNLCRLAKLSYSTLVSSQSTRLASLRVDGAAQPFAFNGKQLCTVYANKGSTVTLTATPCQNGAEITVGGNAYTAGSAYRHTVAEDGETLKITVKNDGQTLNYTLTFKSYMAVNTTVSGNPTTVVSGTSAATTTTSTTAAVTTAVQSSPSSSAPPWWIWAVIGGVFVLVVGAIVLTVILLKKKDGGV